MSYRMVDKPTSETKLLQMRRTGQITMEQYQEGIRKCNRWKRGHETGMRLARASALARKKKKETQRAQRALERKIRQDLSSKAPEVLLPLPVNGNEYQRSWERNNPLALASGLRGSLTYDDYVRHSRRYTLRIIHRITGRWFGWDFIRKLWGDLRALNLLELIEELKYSERYLNTEASWFGYGEAWVFDTRITPALPVEANFQKWFMGLEPMDNRYYFYNFTDIALYKKAHPDVPMSIKKGEYLGHPLRGDREGPCTVVYYVDCDGKELKIAGYGPKNEKELARYNSGLLKAKKEKDEYTRKRRDIVTAGEIRARENLANKHGFYDPLNALRDRVRAQGPKGGAVVTIGKYKLRTDARRDAQEDGRHGIGHVEGIHPRSVNPRFWKGKGESLGENDFDAWFSTQRAQEAGDVTEITGSEQK